MSARTRADELATAIRLRTGVRRYAFAVLDALGHPPVASDPGQREVLRTAVVGPAPIRVLLFGAGSAIGYGVETRAEALDGPLAQLLADRTGRGVVLENRARQHLLLPDAVASLGGVGTHTYDVAIWFPAFADGLGRLRIGSWRNQLHLMIRELRRRETTPLLLARIPVPAGLHPAALVARPWVNRVNRVIDQVASEHDRVGSVATEPFTPQDVGRLVLDAAYYRSLARRIEQGVAELLEVSGASVEGRHVASAT